MKRKFFGVWFQLGNQSYLRTRGKSRLGGMTTKEGGEGGVRESDGKDPSGASLEVKPGAHSSVAPVSSQRKWAT